MLKVLNSSKLCNVFNELVVKRILIHVLKMFVIIGEYIAATPLKIKKYTGPVKEI